MVTLKIYQYTILIFYVNKQVRISKIIYFIQKCFQVRLLGFENISFGLLNPFWNYR